MLEDTSDHGDTQVTIVNRNRDAGFGVVAVQELGVAAELSVDIKAGALNRADHSFGGDDRRLLPYQLRELHGYSLGNGVRLSGNLLAASTSTFQNKADRVACAVTRGIYKISG